MTHTPRYILVCMLVVTRAAGAQNVVVDWAQQATQCEDGTTDYRAVMHVAMFDAVNSITGDYQAYKVKAPAAPGAAPEAAAAAAARTVLAKICPGKKGAYDGVLKEQLAHLDSAARANGVAIGEQVATEIMKLRETSRADLKESYFTAPAPGVYVPTSRQTGTHWQAMTPWLMERPSQFRPGPPPALDSREWAKDLEEIKALGGKKSTARTPQQTESARYWGVHGTNALLRQLATQPGRTLIQNARLFALAYMAWADSYIAMFDGKYAYNFWRPLTAIRAANVKASGADADLAGAADWEPLINTPSHPEYPCGHCLSAATLGPILTAEYGGDAIPTIVFDERERSIRRYTSITQYIDDISYSRLYGGVHYRTSIEVGKQMGRQIGELAVSRYLQPVK